MHMDGRTRGSAPNCLLDYFPEDYLVVVDESHVAVPQIGGMYEGDMSRKRNLVDHGFRLPSAMDNRPLRWEEFLDRIGQTIYLSATPGNYELDKVGRRSGDTVEQIIRPTGLIDPEVVVKPTKGQIDDLIHEIRTRTEKNERVLVTTLTKKMSEDLTDYLLDAGIRTRYLHSEVDTLRRIELLRELRMGEYDVLVGINLLREGLDLPEVSLVSILDADKEGFLRSDKSLIQTIGRAARNVSGQVHMYADKITPSMEKAIEETNRRRAKQVAYNTAAGVDPQPLRKKIADITEMLAREDETTQELLETWQQQDPKKRQGRRSRRCPGWPAARRASTATDLAGLPSAELAQLIQELTDQMKGAAAELHFEVAARLRDEIGDLKKELRQMMEAGAEMTTVKQVQVTFDCADPRALSLFWNDVLGYEFPPPPPGFDSWDAFSETLPPEQRNMASRLGRPGRRRPAAVLPAGPRGQGRRRTGSTSTSAPRPASRVTSGWPRWRRSASGWSRLGATRVERAEPAPPMSGGHIVMQDPEGNEFCLD